jgi:hypothetical protein
MSRRLGNILCLATTFALVACGGNPAGDELTLGAGNTAGESACEEIRTPLGLLEQPGGGLGFSAAEVLAFSAKEHQSMLRWLPVERVSYGPETGDVTLSVTVSYAGGPIELVESTPRPCSDTCLDIHLPCVNALSIEVEVELTTAEGALEERFTADLLARSGLSAEIVHAAELDALGGAFEVMLVGGPQLADPAGAELRQPTFRISFSELGTEGRFEALLVERFGSAESGVAVGNFLEFARWPADES